MKKLFSVMVMMLALNFLAIGGAVGWLFQSGHLDKDKAKQIRAMIFPPPVPPAPAVKTVANAATTRPMGRLDDLMAKQSGRPASEQVEFLQHSFDSQRLELDRQYGNLMDLKGTIDAANLKLTADRAAFEKEKKALALREQESTRLETDKGFQDSLQLYNAMPSKQVKTIFMSLNEATVEQYLDAMQPRDATRIIKEFKTPDETAFIQKVMERMRQAQQASATEEKKP